MKYVLFSILTFGLAVGVHAQQLDYDQQTTCYFEPMPSFPGGRDSLYAFIDTHLEWAQGQATVAGIVFVAFVVNEDGSVSDVKVVKGLCSSCDAAAIEVARKLPKWIPAKLNGVPRKSRIGLPIKFSL